MLFFLSSRKLADVTRNNMLDISEFAVAMHLIQSRLKGTDIPEKLPETLAPAYFPHITVPALSQEEKEAYEKAFMWETSAKTGHVDGKYLQTCSSFSCWHVFVICS